MAFFADQPVLLRLAPPPRILLTAVVQALLIDHRNKLIRPPLPRQTPSRPPILITKVQLILWEDLRDLRVTLRISRGLRENSQ